MQASLPGGPSSSHAPFSVRAETARALRWLTILLCVGVFFTLLPLWVPVVLGAWTAILVRPLYLRLARRFQNREHAAALVTVVIVLAFIVPLVLLVAFSAGEALTLVERVFGAQGSTRALRALVTTENGAVSGIDVDATTRFLQQHGAGAWRALSRVLGATATAVLGVVVFVLCVDVFLADGGKIYRWVEAHAPIEASVFERMAVGFAETGRGVFVGIGLTALAQAGVATIGYVALGLPQPLALGALTAVAALIPLGGAALVWAPVTIALLVSGRPVAAGIMLGIGVVVSTVDNLLRPLLAHRARLGLPTWLVFLSMVGGVAMFGAWGLVLGPLFTRLAKEALGALKDQREAAAREPKRLADSPAVPLLPRRAGSRS